MKGIDAKWVFYLGIIITIEQAIGQGSVSLTNLIPMDWIPYVKSWSAFLALMGTTIMTAMSGYSSANSGPLVTAPSIPPAVKTALVIFAVLVAACILAMPAHAAEKKPLTGNIVTDVQSVLGNQTQSQAAAAAANTSAPTCDFNTFIVLTPANVIALLQACGEKFLADSQAALASATKANDNIATACLTPGTALVQAAVGTPAVPATGTAPAASASFPGPILVFQKFREFVNAGGITNCKAWVNNTITAATASGV